jgi:hypothetical protein
MNKGVDYFKRKNGYTPMEIPRVEPKVIQEQLQLIFATNNN